ncbi:MAG: ATP-binding protein [Spirochaetales bacterium]|jgi:PAS domain S-box-containing protein|nr:ATP-binding protein [Spirochaetales bacterium]
MKNKHGEINMAALEHSDRKEADQLIRAYRYTRGLIESSLDALVTFNKNGLITGVNEQTVRLTEHTREELINSRFRNFFTDPERAAQGVRRSFEEGKVTDYELVMKSKSGKETVVSYNATVYKDEKGQIKGVFAAARDMTEIKKLQLQLLMTAKQASIGRLAAGVAHEIKNQLTPALIEAQRIIEYIETGKKPSYEFILARSRSIEEATRSANRITMALLDYARETRAEFKIYDLEKSIKSVFSLHESKCLKANIQLKLGAVGVQEICADRRQIEQVLINLIDNAYEAIVRKGGDGVITISIQKEDGQTLIKIQDTGVGIAKEDRARIFDPFFTTIPPRGTGLGLSVTYGIVERHGGRIDFDSETGKGSTFRIYLPLIPSQDGGK